MAPMLDISDISQRKEALRQSLDSYDEPMNPLQLNEVSDEREVWQTLFGLLLPGSL